MNLNKHKDFFDPTISEQTIHIIGLGALGSNLAHLLVRLGFEDFVLYDFDDIADKNLTNQFYFNEQIGDLKATSLRNNLLKINPNLNISTEGKYTNQNLYGFVFLCLDSIEERKRIVETNQFNYNITLLTDIRLGLEEGQAFISEPKGFKRLISTMQFKGTETTSPRNACGGVLTLMPTINIITSLVSTNIINFLKNDEYSYMIITDSIEMITKNYK